jgi:hypothetical protein
VRCPEGSVQFDRNTEIAEVPIKRWSHDAPLESALATAKRWNRQRCDVPLADMHAEVAESFDNIVEIGYRSPVVFDRKIDDVRGSESTIINGAG